MRNGQGLRQGAKRLRNKNLLWLIPLALAVIAVMTIAMLPRFVASGYHRATIEALASSLTGRNVHIGGKLSLALLPNPQFIAGDITIVSPDQETITAASLTLDIAPIPLLRGQISARSITLQSPHIALPWPLPGGAAAIAPPRWLTALHAQISNGVVSLGSVTFSHVSADIFTGSDGAFSISGSGSFAGHPVDLSLGFGAVSAVGSTPVTVDVHAGSAIKMQAHISGTYDSSSTLSATASFGAASLTAFDPSLSAPLSGSADITADSNQIAFDNLNLRQGQAALSGTARLALAQPLLTLLLSGQNLTLPWHPGLPGALSPVFAVLPVHLALDAENTGVAGHGGTIAIGHLHSTAEFGAQGVGITSLNAGLPGNSSLSLSGNIDPAGRLQAKFMFNSAALPEFFAAYDAHPALPANWQTTSLAGKVSGDANTLSFNGLIGNFGPAHFTGTAILRHRRKLIGALHFDQLDLTPFAVMLQNPRDAIGAHPLAGDFEISADHASIDKIPLEHLLIDAAFGNPLTVRRLTASLWGGIAAASFTLSPDPDQTAAQNGPRTGLISSARIVLELPSAAPIAALLPPGFALPSSLVKAPLAFSLLAAGPVTALSTSASLTLGAVSITAAPSLDLIHHIAAGAFTLRHPDAIAAFKAFGFNAGLAWPGAGSIALRANMLLSPTQIGFSDFVLSMGDLTGNGRLIYTTDHQLNGEIDADTLALPPIPAAYTPPWADLAGIQGKIAISANRMLWGGNPILGKLTATLTGRQNRLDLDIAQAGLAGGILKGGISAITSDVVPPAKPVLPAITAKLTLSGADTSAFGLPVAFPLTLGSGGIDAAADLTASGYAPQAWLATLSGSASLAARSGLFNGFDLQAAAAALTAKNHRLGLLRTACSTGATNFTQLHVTGSFDNGIYSLAAADLQSPAGTASATGNIDLPDTGLSLNIGLFPNVPSPPALGLTLSGSWNAPHKTADVKKALAWKPPPPK